MNPLYQEPEEKVYERIPSEWYEEEKKSYRLPSVFYEEEEGNGTSSYRKEYELLRIMQGLKEEMDADHIFCKFYGTMDITAKLILNTEPRCRSLKKEVGANVFMMEVVPDDYYLCYFMKLDEYRDIMDMGYTSDLSVSIETKIGTDHYNSSFDSIIPRQQQPHKHTIEGVEYAHLLAELSNREIIHCFKNHSTIKV